MGVTKSISSLGVVMPDPEGRYARLLAAILERADLTMYALAKKTGIPDQTLNRIQHGSVPRLDTIEKLLEAAGLSWKWFAEQMDKIGPSKKKGKPS